MGIKNAIRQSSTPDPDDLEGWEKYADAAERDYNLAMDNIKKIEEQEVEVEFEPEERILKERELEVEVEAGVGGVVVTRQGKKKIGES